MTNITQKLVDFCVGSAYRDFSPEVVDKVKYLALDFIGVAARGSQVESSRIVNSFIRDIGGKPETGVIIGTDMRASCQYAALANGTAAHSIEMDDTNRGHPGSVVFSTAFAVSELAGCGGRRFVEGVVVGYEVMVRLLKAHSPINPYARGFYPTGTCGFFAAVAVAGKLLELSTEQMVSAMGIAGNQASGVMQFLIDGSWSHRMSTGWAAHSGILAALLAKGGFRGPSQIIEGEYGFLHSYTEDADFNAVLDGLGQSYEIMGTGIKLYGCCRGEHAVIDGILNLRKEHNLKPEDVEEVICRVPNRYWNVIAEPVESKRNLRTVMDAQISMPFGAAVALIYGKASVGEHTEENIASSKVRELMDRISCQTDGAERGLDFEKSPPTVEIKTREGKRLSARIEHPKGDPENPVTWEGLAEKYHNLSSPVYSQRKRDEILSRVRKLEQEKKIADFCDLLSRDAFE